MVSKVSDWNSTSVRMSYEINFFPFSWKPNIDENGSRNYHTIYTNYQNLLQKWRWSVDDNFSKHISDSVGMLINKIFSEIRTVLRHIIADFAFKSTPTSI